MLRPSLGHKGAARITASSKAMKFLVPLSQVDMWRFHSNAQLLIELGPSFEIFWVWKCAPLHSLNISEPMFTGLVNTRRMWKCKWKDSAFRTEWAEVKPRSQHCQVIPKDSWTPTWLRHLFHMSDRSSFPATGPRLLGGILDRNMNLVLAYLGTPFLSAVNSFSLGVFLRFLFLHIFLLFLFFGLCLW